MQNSSCLYEKEMHAQKGSCRSTQQVDICPNTRKVIPVLKRNHVTTLEIAHASASITTDEEVSGNLNTFSQRIKIL